MRLTRHVTLWLMIVATMTQCARSEKDRKTVPEWRRGREQSKQSSTDVDELREQIRTYLAERLAEYETRSETGSTRRPREEWLQLGRDFVTQLRSQLHADLMAQIEKDLGVSATPQTEYIPLEAIDEDGDTVEVPVAVETRELRRLTLPSNRAKMNAVVCQDDLALALYDAVPRTIAPIDSKGFVRSYEGDEASAIAMEARFIVELKGGEWVDSDGSGPVANAIAVRGLDWTEGLRENSNQRYDDTMFVIVEGAPGEFEAYEYRMTTESSSMEKGVGRLDSKQVTYVRGLHRGKDPAYRLKGGSADGGRVQMEGTYKITGANIHSAYSRRSIFSDTPLRPNVSLGCQVIAAGKTPFEKSLVFLLDEKGVRQFLYAIVDDEEITLLDQLLQTRGRRSLLVHAILRDS